MTMPSSDGWEICNTSSTSVSPVEVVVLGNCTEYGNAFSDEYCQLAQLLVGPDSCE